MPSTWEMDIDLPRRGSQQFTLLARDVNDGPVDLTDVAIVISVRLQSGDTDLILAAGIRADGAESGIVVTDASGGQILVTLYGEDFDEIEGRYEVVRLAHEIRFTKAGEAPLLVFGQLNLLPE